MKLSFELSDTMDAINELPSAIKAVAVLSQALDKETELNKALKANASYFLFCALTDIADELESFLMTELKKDE